jgi:hypothetical protein
MKIRNVLTFGLMLLSVVNFAQSDTDVSAADRQTARMKSELSLSDKQVAPVNEANRKFAQDQQRLKNDTSLTAERIAEERRKIAEARENRIRQILTPEQFEKWSASKPAQARPQESKPPNPMIEMKKELGLSNEQVRQIVSINTATGKQFQKLRSDTTITNDTRAKTVKSIMAGRREKIRKVLTPDQFTRFVAYEKRKAQERKSEGRPANE